ncbi:MAG TPA: SagB/ThcOx family dehydrogenase [Planctomycetaceae bacterium]|nr:SagB/ThcOx family dehydrogenase [Planctomycetaceae bacterium]
MPDAAMDRYREFLRDTIRLRVDFSRTDQSRGIPPPPLQKPFPPDARRIALPRPGQWQGISKIDLETAIARRQSRRRFSNEPLSQDELAFLLWATQGIRQKIDAGTALRTVPSAGARHALETYLCVFRVDGLEPAVYRYLPVEHELVFEFAQYGAREKLVQATLGQAFTGRSAVTFIWTAIPYRMEWRYGEASHKVIALDAGHVCQNLYLACEGIGAGTCAVAAYHQRLLDQFLRVDGKDEFAIYLAPVGKL